MHVDLFIDNIRMFLNAFPREIADTLSIVHISGFKAFY